MPRRFAILIPCIIAALLALVFLPGTGLDRAAFSLTVRAFTNPPLFITGKGSHSRPYILRTLNSFPKEESVSLPTIISVGDDTDGFFQSSPPSPVDFAIILSNIKRLERGDPAIGFPLAWQETDVISLAALDLQLDALPSVTTSAPLTRDPVSSAMPAAFRRASIPLAQIKGDSSLLPKINSVAIPDAILGNKTSLAGFTILESEPPSKTPYLIARWDDSVVLSFHLLTALRQFQGSPTTLEIHLGEYISFSKNGPFVPIDNHGRLAFIPSKITDENVIRAPALIDAEDTLLAASTGQPLILRNDISNSDQASLDFSKTLAGTVTALTNPSLTSTVRTFKRPPAYIESILVCLVVIMLLGISFHPISENRLVPLIAIAVVVIIHFTLVPATNTWLPTLPALTALLTFSILSTSLPGQKIEISSPEKPSRTPAPEPSPKPAATEVKSRKTAAKKSARKTAKKAATKKTAKKAAKKTTTKTAKKAVKKTAKKNSKKVAKKAVRKTAKKAAVKKSPPPEETA